jgi:acyl-CoA thioesterase I
MRSLRAFILTSLAATLAACAASPAPAPAAAPSAAPAAPAQTAQQLAAAERQRNDWPNLARYREANAALGAPAPGENRVVFMGNSITDAWAKRFPIDFPGKPYVGRGISGQTTPQMLVRFRQDVVALKPKVVVILAGINDIAGNTGPSTQEMIADNIMSMTEIAKANGIRVVLSSVLPAFDFPWHRGMEPAPKVIALNAWLKRYAQEAGVVYLDYHTRMADARGGLSPELASDGVHPTPAGYQIMAPMAEAAIQEALRKPQ